MAKVENFKVVRELYPELKGLFWKARKCPPVDFSQETAWGMAPSGEVLPLADARACDAAAETGHRIFALNRRKLVFSRTVADVCHEGEWSWNYVMSGAFEVCDAPKFLRRWVSADGACGVDGLASSSVVNSLWTELEGVTREQVQRSHLSGTGGYSVEEMQSQGVIPLSAWRCLFESIDAAVGGGCMVNVEYARFMSPDRECERRRIEAAEAQRRLEEQERLAYAAAVNEKTKAGELESIEQARQLACLEFEAKQAEWETAIQKQKIDVEIYEKQKLNEVEVALIRAKNEEEIRKAEALRAGDEAKVSEAAEKIGAMSSALEEVLARVSKVMENLSTMDVSAERLAGWRPPSSISEEAARQYATSTDRFQALLGGLGERAEDALALTWEAARLESGFATRDLMSARLSTSVAAPSQNVLHVGDRMTLKLQSAKSGYLTLFNLGTSGSVFKIFPHPNFGPTESFIEAGRTYSLPGELMKEADFPDGVWDECGPVSDETGRPERILAILTETPVEMDEGCLGLDECKAAMVRGGFAAVEEAVSRLGALEDGSWSFGLLEAWVKD